MGRNSAWETHWQGVAYSSYFQWFEKDANQLLLFPVVSLLGVVLIAQPPFIFDSSDKDLRTVGPNGVTTEQRMAAVWCVIESSFYISGLTLLIPVAFR